MRCCHISSYKASVIYNEIWSSNIPRKEDNEHYELIIVLSLMTNYTCYRRILQTITIHILIQIDINTLVYLRIAIPISG